MDRPHDNSPDASSPSAGQTRRHGASPPDGVAGNGSPRRRRQLLGWLRRTPPPPPDWSQDPWALERPLLTFEGGDTWTIGDACGGVQIFGDTGSGKTSGSGAALAMAMLKVGCGGLVLTAKQGEAKRWTQYMAAAGRLDDLIVFDAEGPHRFNFLQHEATRGTRGGGFTANLVQLFLEAMRACDDGGRRRKDEFWDQASRQMLTNLIDPLMIAGQPVSVSRMYELLQSAPQDAAEAASAEWLQDAALAQTLRAAHQAAQATGSDAALHDLRACANFWLTEYAAVMDTRTRGNIVSTFTAMADRFNRGVLRELFCTGLTVQPEMTLAGKVIVLDLPIKQFHDLGRIAQVVFKSCWQRAVESEERGSGSRPVFLWADEAQYFVTEQEREFVQTAREQKAISVYLTQSRSNFDATMGSKPAVDSFLGVTKTKIFHCNADVATNDWAQRVISEDWRHRETQSTPMEHMRSGGLGPSDPRQQGQNQGSISMTRVREPRVLAREFAALRCGGPRSNFEVDAILFQSGRQFRSGEGNFVRLTFTQDRSLSSHDA